jgi:hypothetical protein
MVSKFTDGAAARIRHPDIDTVKSDAIGGATSVIGSHQRSVARPELRDGAAPTRHPEVCPVKGNA